MKNLFKIFCMATFVLSTCNISAKISNDLRSGARELRKVPDQLVKIVPSITDMYKKLHETKGEVQSKIQDNNSAKAEIESIKKLLDTDPQMQLLPKTNKATLKAALDALTKDDKSGALDALSNILTDLKTRIETINAASAVQTNALTIQVGIAIGKINHKNLLSGKKTLPQRMDSASDILDTFGL